MAKVGALVESDILQSDSFKMHGCRGFHKEALQKILEAPEQNKEAPQQNKGAPQQNKEAPQKINQLTYSERHANEVKGRICHYIFGGEGKNRYLCTAKEVED